MMDLDKNLIDITEIEGLLIDTRISDDYVSRLGSQKELIDSSLDAYYVNGSGNRNSGQTCSRYPDITKVQHNGAGDIQLNGAVAKPALSANGYSTVHSRAGEGQRSYQGHSLSRGSGHEKVCCGGDKTLDRLGHGDKCNGLVVSNGRVPPKFCDAHPNELLTLLCVTCEIPVCDKCVSVGHEEHYVCKRFKVMGSQKQTKVHQVEELKSSHCEELSAALHASFIGIKHQHDVAKQRIKEQFDSQKDILEKWRIDSFQELADWRAEQEAQLTEIHDNLKTLDKHSEDTCELIINILRCGNALEILSLKNFVKTQLLQIINKPEPAQDFHVKDDVERTSEIGNAQEHAVDPCWPLTGTLPGGSTLQLCAPAEEQSALLEVAVILEDTVKLKEAQKVEGSHRAEIMQEMEESVEAEKAMKMRESPTKSRAEGKEPTCLSRYSLNIGSLSTCPGSRIPKLRMDACMVFGTVGGKTGQFDCPRGFCVGWKENIYVADSGNHRIQVFDKDGRFKFQFGGGHGQEEDSQLNHPNRIAAFKDSGKLVVADWGQYSSRLQLFTRNGNFIGKIVTRSVIVTLAGLAVTDTGDIVIVDKDESQILVIKESGEIVFKFGYKHRIELPCDIDYWGNEFYVCDLRGHAVVVFGEDGTFKRRFETKIKSEWLPGGIYVTCEGTVLVAYSFERRFNLVGFNRVGQDLFFSRGPPVRVSTCCGLHLTPDGKLVTISRNESIVVVTKLIVNET